MHTKIFLVVLLTVFLTSCGHRKSAKSFESILEAETGQNHSIAKLNTETGNYVVYKNEVTGEYVAYNLDKFDRKSMNSYAQFASGAIEGVDVVHDLTYHYEYVQSGYWAGGYWDYDYYDEYVYDSWCDCYEWVSYSYSYYVEPYYVDTSYSNSYYTGGGFRFKNEAGTSKNLEMVAALEEEASKLFITSKLTSEFSLSHKRAQELAQLVTNYQKLENSRELTTSEKDKFALDALGVNYTEIESALKEKSSGNEDAYKSLLKKAAKVNKTTSEEIGRFFDEVVEAEL